MSIIDTVRAALYGLPPSQAHQPSKEGVIEAFEQVVQSITALSGGVIGSTATIRSTKALLTMVSAANDTLGIVYNDPITANNGIYHRTAGVWVFTGLLGMGPQGPGPSSETITAATAIAVDAADDANDSAASALASASTAESLVGPTYASIGAGLAATASGDFFAVDNGDGTVSIYLDNAGTAVFQRSLLTTAAAAAASGAAHIGTAQTGAGAVTRTTQAELRDDFKTAQFTSLSFALMAAGKNEVFVTPGNYTGAVNIGNQQRVRGLGSTSTNTVLPGSYLTKSVNGNHATISGDDASILDIHLDGATSSFTGDGLVAVGTRPFLSNVSVTKQRGVGIRYGGNITNGNLGLELRSMSIANDGDGGYWHHTGGGVTGTYPAGIPDINSWTCIGGDFRVNGGHGEVIENCIDNVYVGRCYQNNVDKGLVLKLGARGHKFLGTYAEANNGGGAGPGDEIDIELGATQNLFLGLRSDQQPASGLRDVNPAGKNLVLAYDSGTGSWTYRSKFVLWNAFQDGSTTVDSEAWAGSLPTSVYTIKGSIGGTSGGKIGLWTKRDGDTSLERLTVDQVGAMVLKNSTTFTLGKDVANTTTPGLTLYSDGSPRIDFVNSGSSATTLTANYNSNGFVGGISMSGSSTTFSTASDPRLKQDAQKLTGAIDRIKMLDPLRFRFKKEVKADPDAPYYDGFFAPNVADVVPQAVAGEENAMVRIGRVIAPDVAVGIIVAPEFEIGELVQPAYDTGTITDDQGQVRATIVRKPDVLPKKWKWKHIGTEPEKLIADVPKPHPLLEGWTWTATGKAPPRVWENEPEPANLGEGCTWMQTGTVPGEVLQDQIEPTTLPEGYRFEYVRDGKWYQSVDHSHLVPLLTAALREAIERLEKLELKQ
jgi:hypothetical protein